LRGEAAKSTLCRFLPRTPPMLMAALWLVDRCAGLGIHG
jgi:hypothetical protein